MKRKLPASNFKWPKIGIYIPTIHKTDNLKRFTSDCLASIYYSGEYSIWVDDEWRDGLSQKWNEGLHWGKNNGQAYTFIINNDIVCRHDTFDVLVKFAIEHLEYLAVSSDQVKDETAFAMWAPTGGVATDWFNWSFWMCNAKRLFDKVGIFDANFKPGPFQDKDMESRMDQYGELRCRCLGSCVLHYSDQSRKENVIPDWSKNYEFNKKYLERKYNYD